MESFWKSTANRRKGGAQLHEGGVGPGQGPHGAREGNSHGPDLTRQGWLGAFHPFPQGRI